jgi:hypothetical protein
MPPVYTVGELLPNGATVTADAFTTAGDGTTTETMTSTNPSGSTNHETIVTPGTGTPAANSATLQQRAQIALINNATYLAITNPTTNQAVAQVAALTRQVNALIRVVLAQFDSTVGT